MSWYYTHRIHIISQFSLRVKVCPPALLNSIIFQILANWKHNSHWTICFYVIVNCFGILCSSFWKSSINLQQNNINIKGSRDFIEYMKWFYILEQISILLDNLRIIFWKLNNILNAWKILNIILDFHTREIFPVTHFKSI